MVTKNIVGITKRFINIVKTNRKNFDDFGNNLSEAEINNLLKDDSDDELSELIAEASQEYLPEYIANAFASMEMKPTKDFDLVLLQFKNLMNKYHPDKNANPSNNKQFLNEKTAEIIAAYNSIKEFLEK